MPDRRAPTAAERSTALINDAAHRAVELALAGSEKGQADAIARALRDQRVDGDLREHQRRLDAINGSQVQMATSLADLVEATHRQAAVSEALAADAAAQAGSRFSRRAQWLTALAAVAGWGGILAAVLTALH